jgi:hypothetical protein
MDLKYLRDNYKNVNIFHFIFGVNIISKNSSSPCFIANMANMTQKKSPKKSVSFIFGNDCSEADFLLVSEFSTGTLLNFAFFPRVIEVPAKEKDGELW